LGKRSKVGLIREYIEEIKLGREKEPFTRNDLKLYVDKMGYTYSHNYLNSAVANYSNPEHTKHTPKLLEQVSEGVYKIKR
jgi:hypothetical protein